MKTDNVFIDEESRQKLFNGIRKVYDAVKVSYGAAGGNGLLEAYEYPFHILTNDGISIAERIQLADPIEQIGRNVLLESIRRANKQSGDGSTCTTILTAKIIEEGMKVKDQVSPIELSKSLEECIPIIEKAIDDQTKPISVHEVGKVASISAEDEKIGALIQEIYEQIGKDGILYPDISKTFEDHYTLGTGVKIEGAGFSSPYMADTDENGRFLNVASYKNPHILLTKQKINSAGEISDFCGMLNAREIKELVIFADDYEASVVIELVMTRAKRGFKILLIKMPVLWKDWWFEDLAKMTGATIVDQAAGVTLKTMQYSHLGKCGNIVVDKNDTFLDGIADLTDYIKELNERGDDDSQIRIARLNTKTARLFVGAHSDSALSYKRLKVEDARNSAYLALQYGIVAGGGVALANCVIPVLELNTIGGKILTSALGEPFGQIMINAGIDFHQPGIGGTKGIDVKTNQVVDMFDAGIVDSAKVVKNAAINAISVASKLLTTRVIVTMPPQEAKDQPPVL